MAVDLDLRWIDGALHLRGEIDLANSHRLDEAVAGGRPAESELVLDLSEVDFMDSSACMAILRVFQAHAPSGVTLRDPSPAARKVLDLLCVEDAGPRIVATAQSSASPA